ncbi:MAG: AGE family epimerase/isomerase [Phycisphaerales bacterium]|nr:AGE family epimerase/isomerase [Phycisphaerales bacterium]
MSDLGPSARASLLDDCLPFWLEKGMDPTHGGLHTHLDRIGDVFDTDKSVWAQGRWAWMLAHLCRRVEHRPEWVEAAKSSWALLERSGFDTDGRMFFSITGDGRPLRRRRYWFSECFTAMAAVELGALLEDESLCHRGETLLDAIWAVLEGETTIEPKVDVRTRPAEGLGLPLIMLNVLQVFRDAGSPAGVERRIDTCLDRIDRFVKPELGAVLEMTDLDGELIDHAAGRQLNPGHAIEAASFVLAEALHRSDDSLADQGVQMLAWSFERGWDTEHGGLLSFVDVSGKPVVEYWHEMKFWWPQFEAVVAMLRAWRCTGEQAWHDRAVQVQSWIDAHCKDPDGPEYFGYLRRDGSPSSLHKGDLWKGAFHIPRALLEIWQVSAGD